MLSKHTIILVVGLVSFVGSARSQETSGRPAQNVDTGSGATNDTDGANNPVNPMLTIDLQNYFVATQRSTGMVGVDCVSPVGDVAQTVAELGNGWPEWRPQSAV
jgi:hypothetical protein